MNELSPSELRITLIVRLSVRQDRVLPRALRLIKDLGSTIIDLDEELRRIVFRVGFDKIKELKNILDVYASAYGMEASSILKLKSLDDNTIRRVLREHVRILYKDPIKITAYYKSRLVWLLELYSKKKVLKATLLSIPELRFYGGQSIISPSYYTFTDISFLIEREKDILSDVNEIVEKLREIIL